MVRIPIVIFVLLLVAAPGWSQQDSAALNGRVLDIFSPNCSTRASRVPVTTAKLLMFGFTSF